MFSRKIYLDVGRFEKNDAIIAPSAIISPCAKFTILVTPYRSERATDATDIIMPKRSPFPS